MIWENLAGDKQVVLGILEQNKNFRHFVEQDLPALLEDILGETLTLERLMEAQHRAAAELASRALLKQKNFEKIRDGLSQFDNAQVFLETLGISEKAYVTKRPGLTEDEYQAMLSGLWTVRDLLTRRPAVILGPHLRPTTYIN